MTKRTFRKPFQSRSLWLLVSLSLLGSFAVGSAFQPQGGSAIAQTTSAPLTLRNLVQFYSNFPHQNRAIAVLQQQIDKNQPELLQGDSIASNVWRASAMLAGHTDILPGIAQSDRTGTDPLEMALNIVDPAVGSALDIEVLRDETVESSSAVMITVDQNGALDDSVAGVRQRFDIARQEDGQWGIRRAGRQVRCQVGRGHQNWSAENCL